MNKHTFFANELAEIFSDNHDAHLIRSYEEQIEYWTYMSECGKFRDAVDYGYIEDKDYIDDDVTSPVHIDMDEFNPNEAFMVAKYSPKALHRKHRQSRRKSKMNRRKNSRWVAYFDGTSKECKHSNHRAVRREYDMPIGKSNFSHKVNGYLYQW